MKKILLSLLMLPVVSAYSQYVMKPALDSLLKQKDSVVLKQKLALLEHGSEDDQETLVLYYNMQKNNAKRDAITEKAVQRFPTGTLAFRSAQKAIREEKDEQKRKALYDEAKQQFVNADFTMLDLFFVNEYLEKKEVAKAMPYIASIKNPMAVANIAGKLAVLDANAAEALLAKQVAANSTDTTQAYLSLKALYSTTLVKAGKYDAAFPYAEEVYRKLRRKDPEQIKTYAFLLAQKGRYQEAIPVLEKMVMTGNGDEEVLASLKTAYGKAQPNTDANALVAALEAKYKEHVKTEVARLLDNKPAPSFVVKDVNGKNVSLADFKGKTIVVDFWATWCMPCKRSFPAMKMALNKYKDDPNVKFLFVHTWERATDVALGEASAYLKENSYPFDLYMDYKNPETSKCPAVSSFEVTGIPTKFIIDGKGNIRFKVVGFSGSDIAAAEEVSAMIEMAKGS